MDVHSEGNIFNSGSNHYSVYTEPCAKSLPNWRAEVRNVGRCITRGSHPIWLALRPRRLSGCSPKWLLLAHTHVRTCDFLYRILVQRIYEALLVSYSGSSQVNTFSLDTRQQSASRGVPKRTPYRVRVCVKVISGCRPGRHRWLSVPHHTFDSYPLRALRLSSSHAYCITITFWVK